MHNAHAVINRTHSLKDAALEDCTWPADADSFIPDWVYTSNAVYDAEMDKIFCGRTWNFVALEAEIPDAGDYKRSYVGSTPVVVSRAEDASINVFENRCAHRGAEFCRHGQGNTTEFVCPYHQWSYDLKGNLQGIPFKRGVNRQGGMPKDFRNADHGLKKLHVTTRNGAIFASYSAEVEPLEQYLTPEILEDFDAVFNGRKLKVLGYYKNELPCNWKMYHENLKDPYHATLLHSFLVVFGLLVAGNKSAMISDKAHGRHGTMCSAKSEDKYAVVSDENKKEMRSFHDGMRLHDERFLDYIKETPSPWSVTMQTVWPNLVVQREMNTLGVRQIVPNGPDSMIMLWTMFGYEDDTEEMTRHRLRQGNLMGPAGFLGLEDNEAMKFVQEGLRRSSGQVNVIMLDRENIGSSESLISEACIRGMYRYYREVMGSDNTMATAKIRYRPRAERLSAARATELRLDIEAFNHEYCAVLDADRVEDWPRFFTDDCIYRVTARENAELGLPVGLVYAEGRPMLEDRAAAIARTQMFAPRYTLHMVTNTRVLDETPDGVISAESNFLLMQSLVEGATSIHMAGKFEDLLVRVDGGLLLKERQVIYDTTLIANDLVYPV